MIIREETAADYDAVYELVGEAFAHAEHSDGAEQDLVARLRRSSAFIPQLSLVAQEGGQSWDTYFLRRRVSVRAKSSRSRRLPCFRRISGEVSGGR